MQHERLGSYVLGKKLGSGGVGVVFLAHDEKHDRPVAVKLLHAQAPGQLARFRREFRLLEKLQHPYVVRVFDFSDEDPSYLAMEYISGSTLDQAFPFPFPPKTVAEVNSIIEMCARIAEGLDYVHRQGVVHRDLKPENVLVTQEGVPKITDFGLAFEDEASLILTQPGTMMGTLLYAAPEQIKGQRVDHRADLYALGNMLYFLFAGRTPFEGSNISELILKQIRERPAPLTSINNLVPPSLDSLVAELLEKDPALRPDSAAAVREALIAAPMSTVFMQISILDDHIGLLDPPFLGREQQLSDALNKQTPAIFIAGEAGMGKTRFALEYGREKIIQGWRVLESRPAPGFSVPYQVVTEWLKAIHQRSDDHSLFADEMILAHLLPELGEAPPLPTGQAQLALISAAFRVLQKATAYRPLVLVLDGFDRIDEGSLAFVAYALHNLSEEQNIQFLITYRPNSLERNANRLIRSVEREELAYIIELAQLSSDDTSRLIKAMLGGLADASLIQSVSERARGNPWVASEVLKGLLESGDLWRERGCWEWSHDSSKLPSSLHEAFEERFSRLDHDVQDIAAAAAVVGEEFTFEPVLALCNDDEDDVLDALEELIRAGIVQEERLRHDERYKFAHPMLQEVSVTHLSSRKFRRLHLRYAEMLEQEDNPKFDQLAKHFAEAGRLDKAGAYALQAAESAERLFSLASAEPYLRLVYGKLEEDHDLYPYFQVFLGKITSLTGRSEESEELLKAALQVADEDLLPNVRYALGDLYQRQGKWDEAIRLLEPHLRKFPLPDAWIVYISCLRFSGDVEAALEKIEEAQTIFLDQKWQAELQFLKGATLKDKMDFDQAEAILKEALDMFRQQDNIKFSATTLNELGRIARNNQRLDEAAKYYEDSIELWKKLQDWRGVAALEINIAGILSEKGDGTGALERSQQALIFAERSGYKDLIAASLINAADGANREGKFDVAKTYASRAVDLCRELDSNAWVGVALQNLCRAQTMLHDASVNSTLLEIEQLRNQGVINYDVTKLKAWPLIFNAQNLEDVLEMLNQEDEESLLMCIDVLMSLGREEEARELWQSIALSQTTTEDFKLIIAYLEVWLFNQRHQLSDIRETMRKHHLWEWAHRVKHVMEQKGSIPAV